MVELDCSAAMRQLWDYLDEELTPEREAAVRAHLAACANCQPHEDFERAFLDALSRARGNMMAPDDVRAEVSRALREAGFISG